MKRKTETLLSIVLIILLLASCATSKEHYCLLSSHQQGEGERQGTCSPSLEYPALKEHVHCTLGFVIKYKDSISIHVLKHLL